MFDFWKNLHALHYETEGVENKAMSYDDLALYCPNLLVTYYGIGTKRF